MIKNYYLRLLVAFFCCAISGTVQWREQSVPEIPPADRIAWEPNKTWFHNMKNEWTESVRFNAEYWGKHLSLAIVLEAMVIAALIAVIIALMNS